MLKRRIPPRRKSRREFSRNAMRVHPKNDLGSRNPPRGGIQL